MNIKAKFIASIFFLLGCMLITGQWSQVQRMPNEPLKVQLADLKEKYEHEHAYWVALEGGTWECKSIHSDAPGRTARTKILYISKNKVAVYAEFSGSMDCEDVKRNSATGTLTLMNNRMLASEKKENPALSDYANGSTLFYLCTFCSKTNAKAGVIVGALMILTGLWIVYCDWREYKQSYFLLYKSLNKKQHFS